MGTQKEQVVVFEEGVTPKEIAANPACCRPNTPAPSTAATVD